MAIFKKIGTRVVFSSPIKKVYDIETNDKALALGIAIDYAKGCYPCNNWNMDNIKYEIGEYRYKGIKW